MPFYRINGLMVHMRGTKLPKACMAVVGFSSLHAERSFCLGMSGYLCDWAVAEGKTCDRPMCAAHAHQVGKNRHYCPDHFAQSTNGHQRSLFTSLVQA